MSTGTHTPPHAPTMRAAVYRRFGGPDLVRVEELPRPRLSRSDAYLVAVAEAGHYRAVRDRTYDLTDIAEAHRYVDTGHKRGNVVVRIGSSRQAPTPFIEKKELSS